MEAVMGVSLLDFSFSEFRELLNYYLSLDTYITVIVSSFVIFVLFYYIKVVKGKLGDYGLWSGKEKYRGMVYALSNDIPLSKVNFSTSSIFSIGGIVGFYGTYMSFSSGTWADYALETTVYILLLMSGILANVLVYYKNKFKKVLKKYHTDWIRDNYKNIIEGAKYSFGSYGLSKIPGDESSDLSDPYIFAHAKTDSRKREHIDRNFFDKWLLHGVFPTHSESIFFFPKDGFFEFDLKSTIFNHYAAEHAKNLSYGAGESEEISKSLDEAKISENLNKLNFITENFDNESNEVGLEHINNTYTKSIIFSRWPSRVHEEHFYKNVEKIDHSDDGIAIQFGDERRFVPSSSGDSVLKESVQSFVRKKIRDKKSN